jgi:Protein of unknown function (DUF1559)
MRRIHWVVLVVLILVALPLSFLVFAVSHVREASARTKCINNFRQLALAMHSYADANDQLLPAGTVPNDDLAPERRLSWYVPILPYIEQSSVYQQFDLKAAAEDERNRSAIANRFPQSFCPGSSEYDYYGRNGKSTRPITHYVGVSGIGSAAATLPAGHPKAGAFGYDRRTALSKEGIPDGTSNTLLLIETAYEPGHWAFGGPSTVRGLDPGTAPYVGPGRPFGGLHDGGWVWRGQREQFCNIAMADGSSRTFNRNRSPEVLEALATVAGKEDLPADW